MGGAARTFLFISTAILAVISVNAQTRTGIISGLITDNSGVPIPFANVVIESLQKGTVANGNGEFQLEKIPEGDYSLKATSIGFEPITETVSVNAGKPTKVDFKLTKATHEHGQVTVTADATKSEAELVREEAYTVTSIDVKPIQNLNLDVNTVLNRTTGIRIRQSGGLGSDFKFSLNGFSGNQVRFFIDGIPSDLMGSAMQFNNIPVNTIERVEVYKGVVPVHLGADALGGAVNIITSNNAKDFLDVSYSFGSFNTHRFALTSRVSFKDHYVLNTSGFFNYSDNDFTIEAPYVDPETGIIGDYQSYKLFNEQYMSGSGLIEGGVVRKKWADRFLIGLIVSGNKKHYQRGQTLVLNPIGEAHSTNLSFTPTLKYQKKNLFTKGLSFNFTAIYAYNQSTTADTSSKIFNWDGSYETRAFDVSAGEFSYYKTLFTFDDHATVNTATVNYDFLKHHSITLNNTFSFIRRQGSDPVASRYSESLAFEDPNTISENITGLSYKFSWWNNRWNTTVFIKSFYMNAGLFVENEETDEYEKQDKTHLHHGEGIATSLAVLKGLLFKASYEYTTRLPESYELFGDGKLLLQNAELEPEKSHNANFGALYTRRFGNGHRLSLEGGFIYRKPKDLIRLVSKGVLAQYVNLSSAEVLGGEASFRYGFKHWIDIEVNATYQDMRNTNRVIDSYPDPLYRDRIPNIPFLFGNAVLALKSPVMTKHRLQVGFNWTTSYVEEFFLNWPSQGSVSSKHVIPTQVSHDASVSVSAFSGKYSLSFTCANLADSKLYDNFRVQRPGRSFNVKFRFYLEDLKKSKSNNTKS